MTNPGSNPQSEKNSEQAIQDWLESVIAEARLRSVVQGTEKFQSALQQSNSSTWWPSFPIDYLCRVRVAKAANTVWENLFALELVSHNRRSISRTKYETLFTDLLYCNRETSQFAVVEVKKDKATARETVTELLAYEHEIFNHVPFAGRNDLLMVVVSRKYSPLLDHAITGLITWGNRQILCLRYDDESDAPALHVHLPQVWAAVGQTTLPASGIQTAYLYVNSREELSNGQWREVYETASLLLARQAERQGNSGFVMVAENILYPRAALSPYLLIVGIINPFCFLSEAQRKGMSEEADSALSEYLLKDSRCAEMAMGWDWTPAIDSDARRYLDAYGDVLWENFSDWSSFRDPARWGLNSVTPDRHLRPVSAEFWGAAGDFARDLVSHTSRMKNFMPGFCRPGLDWRHPWLATYLLDQIAVMPVIEGGQWTFSALFALGVRLGRFTAIAATYADMEEAEQHKMKAGLFWAEIDLLHLAHELAWRYQATPDISTAPPRLPIGIYVSSEQVVEMAGELANWVLDEFITQEFPLHRKAVALGLRLFPLGDPQFTISMPSDELRRMREQAAIAGRDLLEFTLKTATSFSEPEPIFEALGRSLGQRLHVEAGTEAAMKQIQNASDDQIIAALFEQIPHVVDLCTFPLTHLLAEFEEETIDWDWIEQLVSEHRARGTKYPCVIRTPLGEIAVGSLNRSSIAFAESINPSLEVLFIDQLTFGSFALVVKWDDLRSGKFPGNGPSPQSADVGAPSDE